MRITRLSTITTAGILAVVLMVGMVPAVSAAQEDIVSETEAQAALEKIQIGEKRSDSDYEVTLVNECGKAITGIALRASYEEYSDNLLPEDTVLEEHGQGTLWCEPAEILNFVPPEYDIQLTFADESTAVLHTIPFGDADELTILTDEESGTVYVRFISLSQNSESNSLQREKNIAQSGDGVGESKRQEVKQLLRTLRRDNPDIEKSMFNAIHAVCLDTFPGWKTKGVEHTFLEGYDER